MFGIGEIDLIPGDGVSPSAETHADDRHDAGRQSLHQRRDANVELFDFAVALHDRFLDAPDRFSVDSANAAVEETLEMNRRSTLGHFFFAFSLPDHGM